jgi:hypothetical protein
LAPTEVYLKSTRFMLVVLLLTMSTSQSGIPERVAMMMTGHKTASVFQRSQILSDGDLIERVAEMNAAASR